MNNLFLCSSLVVIIFLSGINHSSGQNDKKILPTAQEYCNQYQMPVYGLNSEKDTKKLIDHLKKMDGILFAAIEEKTNQCMVITKDFITVENVIDILRVENCKTDDYSAKKISKPEAEKYIKQHQSEK